MLFAFWLLAAGSVTVTVRDPNNVPLPRARVAVAGMQASTGADGRAQVSLDPGRYTVTASAEGFQTLRQEIAIVGAEATEIEFVLPRVERQSVTVEEKITAVESGAATGVAAAGVRLKELPERLTSVRDALPLMPGVVRTPEGKLQIGGAPEERAALLVNTVDVTDPATGRFGATVPIDIVERLNVYKTPFLAEYGRFTAGVVAVETRRGGDRWRWELNDPTPEFRLRSGHIHGVRGFTPRLSGGGPVIANKLWFMGAGEYALRKRPVYPLPFPYNEEKRESVNAHVQLDWAPSAAHLVTFTGHGVPQKANFVGLSFYTPQPSAPSYKGHEWRGALSDRWSPASGLLESTVAVAQIAGNTGAQGNEPLSITPTGALGNYFFQQNRTAERLQWTETFTAAPRGKHNFRFGGQLIQTRLNGDATARPLAIRDLPLQLLEIVQSPLTSRYRLSDTEAAGFFQDGWQVLPSLRIDGGVRSDYQRITGTNRFAPRLGLAWMPFSESSWVFRVGWGWFFDRVPLNIFAFPGLRTTSLTDFRPRSTIWSVQVDRPLGRFLHLRTGYVDSRGRDLIILPSMNELSASGQMRTQQFETILRVRYAKEQDWLLSYTHTRTRGNLNEFPLALGDFPAPVIRPDTVATAAGNIPHRFLSWGVFPLPYGLRFSPVLEWRTGFPYSALDERQQYAGEPNSLRFPAFFSLDLRMSKDIPYRKHMFRLSFSVFNSTDHANYDAVRWNIADPQFGELLGRRPRRWRLDFDWLF